MEDKQHRTSNEFADTENTNLGFNDNTLPTKNFTPEQKSNQTANDIKVENDAVVVILKDVEEAVEESTSLEPTADAAVTKIKEARRNKENDIEG